MRAVKHLKIFSLLGGFLSGFVPFIMMPWLDILNSFVLYVCFLLIFSIAEFFDEDISDILIAHSKIKTKANSFYA
ncbi:hypothetical protein [Helicobacter pylori]|uniref:hypothetical protein n=1 Tax=Helicobacter pylori TaxID=210 RepID=UPI000992B0A3|nr:hypothetical protein B0X36_04635 [Helicobacter pylori]OPG45569.1 hypothetical protein BGL75_02585 [Helicobacter pylori]PDX10144.1 hypothetical protein BB407_05140 [Helicobacter pylori]